MPLLSLIFRVPTQRRGDAGGPIEVHPHLNLQPGSRIGEIVSLLGTGGMGEVYRTHRTRRTRRTRRTYRTYRTRRTRHRARSTKTTFASALSL
jgi:hypothetical protein